MKDADFSQLMTAFDRKTSSRPLQMLKIMLPFLPPNNQRMIGIYVKFMEFQNVIQFFQGMSADCDPYLEIKQFIPSSVWDSYEEMLNLFSMFQEMQSSPDFDPMSMMSDMFTMNGKDGDTDDGLDQ